MCLILHLLPTFAIRPLTFDNSCFFHIIFVPCGLESQIVGWARSYNETNLRASVNTAPLIFVFLECNFSSFFFFFFFFDKNFLKF